MRLDYDALGGAGKGMVGEFLGKATGLSRAQVTRLVAQYRESDADRIAAESGIVRGPVVTVRREAASRWGRLRECE